MGAGTVWRMGVLPKVLVAVAAVLASLLAVASPAAAQTATPTFVSPEVGTTLAGQHEMVVEVDHQGLDITSGWIFVGKTLNGNEYKQQHMGTSETAWVGDLTLFFNSTIHLSYVYKVEGQPWARISQTNETTTFTRVTVNWQDFFGPWTATLIDENPLVESTWIKATNSRINSTIPNELYHIVGSPRSVTFVGPWSYDYFYITLYYKVAGVWHTRDWTFPV